MDLRIDGVSKTLVSLLINAVVRTHVVAEGQFHLGPVDQFGLAILTRTNSETATRIRVKGFSNLNSASVGKLKKLANNESCRLNVEFSDAILGSPSVKLTWTQGLRRYETDLSIYTVGIF